MAKQADRAMIGQVRLMLNKFGAKIKASIHSAGEPAVLAKALDNMFGPFWKEVEKSLLDSFILETGFQVRGGVAHARMPCCSMQGQLVQPSPRPAPPHTRV